MYKYFQIILVIFLTSSCSNKESKEKQALKQRSEIRLYNENIGWDQKVKCKISYKGEVFFGRVKFRGGMSSRYDKHSMTVEFKEERSITGLPKNDDWILNASYIDKTFQRHKLSYDLFRMMSPENKSPQCAYISVYVNDNYRGLYVIMEKVNGSWLHFDKNNPKQAMLFKDAPVFRSNTSATIKKSENSYEQKFPKRNKVNYTSRMDRFKLFLFESSDAEFESKIGQWVDLKSIMDWQLLLMFTNNDDGLYKNFYLYSDEDSKQLKVIPWDYDHSFGRDGDYEMNLIDRELGWENMILFKRLMRCDKIEYSKLLKSRWNELRKSVFTEERINEMIDQNDMEVAPYIEENSELWPMKSKWYSDSNFYDEELEILRKFVPMRLKQLDNFFNTF